MISIIVAFVIWLDKKFINVSSLIYLLVCMHAYAHTHTTHNIINILIFVFRFGYIDFHSNEDAVEAIRSPVVINGRQIVLDMAETLRPPDLKGTPVHHTQMMGPLLCIDHALLS